MTRLLYDQFAKQLLKELLEQFGRVETSMDVAAEVRQIDFFFVPKPETEQERQALGLLGKLTVGPGAFEPFRNAVQPKDIRNCIGKLYDLHNALDRQQARQNKPLLDEEELPQLWILSPTASAKMLGGFRAEEEDDWPQGVYLFGPSSKVAVIAIHQLPRTPETMWLRMLGKGRVQKEAIAELRDLPEDNQFRVNALELVYNLLSILEARQDLEREDEKLLMELSPLYTQRLENATQTGIQQGLQQGLQQGIQQGIQQGTQQGQRLMVESMLRVKFGEALKQSELNQIIDALTRLPALESTRLIMQLSLEKLLERFRPRA